MTYPKAALASSMMVLAWLNAGVAHAAEAPAAAPAAAEAAPDASASADSGSRLSEIVVTATKRETNLQKTPVAISVVSDQLIKDRHVQSLIDLADGGVPSLRVATFEARQSALTVGIRGIVPFDQNQTARDTGVGVYIDGVYLARSQGLNAALFDVQRIEVLKGPQGTLFGRNTEGGAVSIVTKDPTGQFDGRFAAGVGNFGSHSVEGHLDLPEFNNIAIKIDGVQQHQDPTVKNPLAGQAGWNQYDRTGGRISAKWTPMPGFSAVVSYDKAKDENTPNYSQLINYNPQGRTVGQYIQNPNGNGKYILVAPGTSTACSACIAPLSSLMTPTGDNRVKVAPIGVPQQPSVDRTEGTSLHLNYDVAPHMQLRSITAWRTVSTEQWDNSGGAARTIFAPNTGFSRYSLSYLNQRQFSQELQLVGSLPQVDYVLGAYYFNERAQEQASTPSSNTWNVDGTGYTINSETVVGPVTSSNQGWAIGQQFLQRASQAFAKSYAAFGQATFTPDALGDKLHLTVGGRYTNDKRDGTLYLVQGAATNYQFHESVSRFDPLIVAAYDLTDNIHAYAKYSTGYRAGGANDRSQTFAAFGPEAVKAYEIGTKMDLMDHRVRLNLAGYMMDRTGTQTDFDNVDTRPYLDNGLPNPTFNLHTEETRNAPGTSRIRGVEADLTVQAAEGLTLSASYAYTYTHVPATANPFLNNQLYQVYVVYTPANAASGAIDYALPVNANGSELRVHLDANYADPQYSFQNESVKTDSSFVVNGRIALASVPLNGSAKATFSAWSRNLFNTTYIYRRSGANDAVLGDYGNFNPPRTFGGEIAISF
ncbi:iron complex outermembrane receptor protein [Novosphingobium capsulatum]|uniref:Iron complex outermembrane receptor protein n=2 Tax=Novosphingobium capsulatum TaxID=13688 RepID=A0ABU1ML99_9SPHN|nr:iron complex outermembrane receptor protein [Novosphingobium capsulatum]